MSEILTWRDLLSSLVPTVQERNKLAQTLRIHPMTLQRWIKGTSVPRPHALKPLLQVFPEHQQLFIELLAKDGIQLSPPTTTQEEDTAMEIPNTFYNQIFRISTTHIVHLRVTTICTLIMRQLLRQLDPSREGMGVTIAQCVSPREGKKVRSLRVTFGHGTGILSSYFGQRTQFLGIESRIGSAIASESTIIVQDAQQQEQIFPGHLPPKTESALTRPIFLAEKIAGCLGVFSTQPHFFTWNRQQLIEQYAELLTIAFEPEEFYTREQIELQVMPPNAQQRLVLAQFQQRISQKMAEAVHKRQQLTSLQATTLVWQEIEEDLLHLASLSSPFSPH